MAHPRFQDEDLAPEFDETLTKDAHFPPVARRNMYNDLGEEIPDESLEDVRVRPDGTDASSAFRPEVLDEIPADGPSENTTNPFTYTSYDHLFNWGFPDRPATASLIYIPGLDSVPVPTGSGSEDYIRVPSKSKTQFEAAYYLGYCGLPDELQQSLRDEAEERGRNPYCPEQGYRKPVGLLVKCMALSGVVIWLGLYLFIGWKMKARRSRLKEGERSTGVVEKLKQVGIVVFWPVVLLWVLLWTGLAKFWSVDYQQGKQRDRLANFLKKTAVFEKEWKNTTRHAEAETQRRRGGTPFPPPSSAGIQLGVLPRGNAGGNQPEGTRRSGHRNGTAPPRQEVELGVDPFADPADLHDELQPAQKTWNVLDK